MVRVGEAESRAIQVEMNRITALVKKEAEKEEEKLQVK